MALLSSTQQDRLTVKVARDQLHQIEDLVAQHRPYLQPHMAARAALYVGLKAINNQPELLPAAVEQLTHRTP